MTFGTWLAALPKERTTVGLLAGLAYYYFLDRRRRAFLQLLAARASLR
jgi:hypothetical protein